MSAMSDYLENELLDHALGTGSWTMPSGVYVKLHIGAPGEAGTANAAAETTRKVFTCAAASGGATSNAADITWTNLPAAETISHVSIWDAATSGNCLFTGALAASKTVAIGDNLTISAGDLDLTFA